uniref:RELT-like protein 2 n=1 Tax=Euleptes europaea TaxID=460621 RepID=UPI0025420FE6|nr:RELT-like protein 2 [Euleptes europaea]
MSEQNSTQDGEAEAQHSLSMPFLMVLVFFGMGLVGFLICHVLKKKGYRCRTYRDELDLVNKEPLTQLQNDEDEEMNDDTVEKIVKCIIQNEANVEVLKEMLGERDAELAGSMVVPVPSLCPHRNSQDGGVPHHHTVHLGSAQAPCMHCSQKKRRPLHRQGRSKEGKSKMHPGETTVFSVGRFHVTHIGKKPASHGSKEESLPDSNQDLGSGDLDRETREGSQNGIVLMDRLQHGRFQEAAGARSDRGPKKARKDNTQGESLLNATSNLEVSKNGPERKKHPRTGSLPEADQKTGPFKLDSPDFREAGQGGSDLQPRHPAFPKSRAQRRKTQEDLCDEASQARKVSPPGTGKQRCLLAAAIAATLYLPANHPFSLRTALGALAL